MRPERGKGEEVIVRKGKERKFVVAREFTKRTHLVRNRRFQDFRSEIVRKGGQDCATAFLPNEPTCSAPCSKCQARNTNEGGFLPNEAISRIVK
jgi:hypothetical protein